MKKSFTLIELLVVISIVVIFIGTTLTQYNTFTQQSRLKNEAKKLVDVLELAKKKASSGDLSDKTCNETFKGYEVNIQTNSYAINLRCLTPSTPQQIAVYNYPNLNISTESGGGLFRFMQLNAGLEYKENDSSDPSNPPLIQIKNSVIDKCVNITISSLGIVELDEALVPCI
jgi:Tfp pilus assembly protein FimT